jgi:hypothetical protein
MTAILILFYYNDYYLPFKDKKSADIVRGQLAGLGSLIGKSSTTGVHRQKGS